MRLALAAVLALAASVSQAAVFHLENVVLGTYATVSDPISRPYAVATGFFVYDGLFDSSTEISNYKITFSSLKGKFIGSLTPTTSSTYDDRFTQAATTTTFLRVNAEGTDHGFNFYVPIGAGVEIDRGLVPLLIRSDNQSAYSWGTIGGNPFPVLSGWLKVDNKLPRNALSAITVVPEPSAWLVVIAGLGMVGLGVATKRDRTV